MLLSLDKNVQIKTPLFTSKERGSFLKFLQFYSEPRINPTEGSEGDIPNVSSTNLIMP